MGQYFDFKRVTVSHLEHRLSKHQTTRYARNLGSMASLAAEDLREFNNSYLRNSQIHIATDLIVSNQILTNIILFKT